MKGTQGCPHRPRDTQEDISDLSGEKDLPHLGAPRNPRQGPREDRQTQLPASPPVHADPSQDRQHVPQLEQKASLSPAPWGPRPAVVQRGGACRT